MMSNGARSALAGALLLSEAMGAVYLLPDRGIVVVGGWIASQMYRDVMNNRQIRRAAAQFVRHSARY
jgi:hypothetical protein